MTCVACEDPTAEIAVTHGDVEACYDCAEASRDSAEPAQ